MQEKPQGFVQDFVTTAFHERMLKSFLLSICKKKEEIIWLNCPLFNWDDIFDGQIDFLLGWRNGTLFCIDEGSSRI